MFSKCHVQACTGSGGFCSRRGLDLSANMTWTVQCVVPHRTMTYHVSEPQHPGNHRKPKGVQDHRSPLHLHHDCDPGPKFTVSVSWHKTKGYQLIVAVDADDGGYTQNTSNYLNKTQPAMSAELRVASDCGKSMACYSTTAFKKLTKPSDVRSCRWISCCCCSCICSCCWTWDASVCLEVLSTLIAAWLLGFAG